jgi:predicted O-methyltransferase YrrM
MAEIAMRQLKLAIRNIFHRRFLRPLWPIATHGFLYRLSKEIPPPVRYLEVGVREGDSMNAILQNPNVTAVGVDSWGAEAGGTARGSADHVKKYLGPEKSSRVTLHSGDSHVLLKRFKLPEFNLIYVDGDHSEAGAIEDMDDCLKLLAPGGTMLVDDIDHPAHSYLRATVLAWAARNNMAIKTHDVGQGVAEMRRKDAETRA